ncbi:MAG TPA: AsmA family protein [Bryobacteraceae bacterium]|nr:AsmA family protein [Bryobacteraceae bacterium]
MKRILVWIGIVVAALLAVSLALPFLIDANAFRPRLESTLTAALGRPVRLGELKLALFSGGISANDLSVDDDPAFSKSPFLRAKQLKVGVEMGTLIFSRRLNVTGLTIDQPEIVLVESAPGVWNFSSLGTGAGARRTPPPSQASSSSAPLDLSVKLLKVTNGRLTLGRTGNRGKPIVLEQVEIELQNFSGSAAFPFTLTSKVAGGGSVKLAGTAGPLDSADASRTPLNASLSVNQLDLALSRLNDWAPSLAGVVSFDGTGASDGKTVRISGKLKGDKLKLARNGTPAHREVELDFAVEHDLRGRSGVVSRGDIHIGGALAHVTGTYAEQGDSMLLKMNLSGSNMPATELAGLLPAVGVVLPAGSSLQSGSASVRLSAEGPADRLVTSGSVALNNAKLAGFDMGRKMSTIETLAGIRSGSDTEIQTLSANVRYAPDGASVQNIQLVLAGVGDVAGGGTISPQDALNFKMTATVHGTGLAAVVSDTPIPFTIQGTASDPQFRPDVKGVAAQAFKGMGGDAGKTATGILKGLLGGKKKP